MHPRFPERWSELDVVLSHDWLTGMRGGERVLDLLCRGFPGAPVFTLLHRPAAVSDAINRHPIRTSWLQNVPAIFRYYRYFLPLFPAVVSRWQPPPAELLISTSHCVAKGVAVANGTRHLCYCFTPMRYVWTFYTEYFGTNTVKKRLVAPLLDSLRRWDRETAQRVDRFVAISEHVRKRIRAFYDREADVVYPPVDTDFYTPAAGGGRTFDLVVSALVPYKRIDLAVRAYTRSGARLKVVGTGTELSRLAHSAGPNVEFLGWRSNEEVRELYRNCRCVIFPGEEDFGIVPVEAQACGRPVVAYRKGGALETVVENVTGLFFDEPDAGALWQAVEECSKRPWDPAALRRNAERFRVERFIDGLDESIRKCLARRA